LVATPARLPPSPPNQLQTNSNPRSNKLSKLPGNKDARRSLNKEMRSLVAEQLGINNAVQPAAAAAAGGGGAVMAE
jgi:hypothetical protein